MKSLRKIFALTLGLLFAGQVSAQTVVAGGSPLVFSCGGGIVHLTAVGESTTPVFGDDFNGGTLAAGWAATASADFSNPCGTALDGTTYLWMGPTATAPRSMTTAPVDVSCGGTVCFDFKFVCEACGDSSPCEGADFYNEGVSLQFSTDGGATFTDFAYFAPNGDILTAYPGAGVTWPSASGTTPFTDWGNYCFPIPAAGESGATVFRLYQWGSSSAIYDHWGIDNFYVYADPCAPFYYDWDHIPGAPDSPDVSTVVTESGTYTVCYTDGITSVCDDVTVIVDEIDITAIDIVLEPCLGDDDASITFTVAGGTPTYTYDLTGPSPGTNTTGVFTGLAPGLYTISISDAGTCVTDSSFTIDPGTPCCSVTAAGTDALCNGEASGSALATPGAGGTPPYAYEWFDDLGTPIGITTPAAGGLAAGDYSVTITDASGCTASADVTIDEPTAITAGTTLVDPLCFGDCNGEITVTGAAGGTPGYEYNINGGLFQVSNVFTGLCDGTYTIIVEDANGCQTTITDLILSEPADLTLTEISTTPETCGSADGTVDVDAGGGTPGYTYDLGGTTNATGDFTGLTAGTHTITVTDANGCTETIDITIDSEDGPVPFVDVLNDVTCFGGLNGSVTIGVTGGVAAFTFALDGGLPQASNTFPAVSAGPHTVEVTDANGCTGTVDFVVGEPTELTYTVTITDALCFGACDGTIDIDASGATPPYTYSDDAGATFGPADVLTGLCAGAVNIVVSDVNGCLANSLEVVGEPTELTATATHTEPSCNGTPDGEIDFDPIGGTPGYTFSVDGGASFTGTDPVTGIAGGDYDLVVEDANGCQYAFTHTVNEPPPFTFTYIANNPSNCGASDGSFEIIATDGLAPYSYSIDGGVTTFPDGLFEDLLAGLYTLVVEDANGCVDSVYEALSDIEMTTEMAFINNATCFNGCNGSAGITFSPGSGGAAPFTYEHTYDGVVTTSAFPNFFFLCAGTHYIQVTDDGDCVSIQEFEITEPDTISFTPTTVDITCPGGADGEIDFGAVIGGDGGPYNYSIDGGATFGGGPVFTGLTAGTYDIYAEDGNGCLGMTTVTLVDPDPITAIITETDLLCNGDGTGVIQVVADGGTVGTGYSYTIGATTNTTGVFISMAAGGYTITITDGAGCTKDTTATLIEPAALTANYTITDALCFGSCDGEVDVDAAGGTTPYVYSSDGGTITGSSDILGGLCAGDHDIYVEDDNGCTVLSTETVGEPTELSMTLAINPATCGLDNGDITITAAGGTPGYTYSNDAGTTFGPGNVFAGLVASDYNLVIEDNNGCQLDSLVTVIADATPVIDAVALVDPLCNGDANGSITITSSMGVGVHQYSIGGPFQASNVFAGLAAGTYTVTVEDANGCTATQIVDLIDPPALTYTAVVTDLLCFDDFSGSIVVTEAGGTGPYLYSSDGGASYQPTGDFSFIAAGTYDIEVLDANGCTVTGTENVNEPAELLVDNTTSTDATCFGFCDGDATATIIGGTLPYTYAWGSGAAGAASATAIDLCAGTYLLDVTDDNGCTVSTSFNITEPPMLVISSISATDASCNGDCDGSIIITSTTATQYSIDGGATYQVSNTFIDLCAGTYDVVVQNATGCTESITVTINEPTPVVLDPISDITICYDGYGTLEAFATGGNAPYNYVWDATDTVQFLNVNLTAPATFSCTVYDFNGCPSNTETADVSILPQFIPNVTPDVTVCPGQEATFTAGGVGGVAPYYFQYLNTALDTLSDGPATYTYTPTAPETLTLVARDDCWYYDTLYVNVTVLPEVTPTFSADPANGCSPLEVTFTNTTPPAMLGGTCSWDFGNGSTSALCDEPTTTYYTPGCYDVTLSVVSADGCTGTATLDDIVCVYEDPTPGFYWTPNNPSVLDPTIEVINTSPDGTGFAYDFGGVGSSNEMNPVFTFPSVDEETEYIICQTVTNDFGCEATSCQAVTIIEEVVFYVPNSFTPDGDDYNEEFFPVFTAGVDPYDYHLTIFNRWGEIIFESFNYDNGWPGTYGNQGLVEDGVYIWQIEFGEKNTDKKRKYRGHVTVLK